jgi:NO-binding membrane sensor protein with MHYT domain
MGLYVEYRAAFLSLTGAVSFIGTYGAVAACEQFRIAICSGNKWPARYKQLLLVAVCLGGVCIWGEFYMMMSAYRLHTSSGAIILRQYNTALCVGSIPVVIVLTYIGLLIASTDPYFTRSKKEVAEVYRSNSVNFNGSPLVDLSSFKGNLIVSMHNPWRIIIGSLFMSAALVVMRSMGIASIYIPGKVVVADGTIVAQAVIAVVGSATGFLMYFRLLSLHPSCDMLRIACAVHGVFLFTGARAVLLAGTTFEYDPTVAMPSEEVSLTSSHLVVGVIISTVMTSFLALVYVLSDLRAWLQRTTVQQRQADRALLALLYRPAAERNLNPVATPQAATGARNAKFTQSQRQRQAPPEVVNYTRQYLKAVPQRSASPTAIFTAQHRLFYDVDPDKFGVPECSLATAHPEAPPQRCRQHCSLVNSVAFAACVSPENLGTASVSQSVLEERDNASEGEAV